MLDVSCISTEVFLEHPVTASLQLFEVEVAYALPDYQTVRRVQVAHGTTLKQAVAASGLLVEYPEIDLSIQKTGIFGQLKSLDTLLYPNDRIEIYRPLLQDPKEARHKRVKENRENRQKSRMRIF